MATFADNSVANFFFTRHGDQNGRSLERWIMLRSVVSGPSFEIRLVLLENMQLSGRYLRIEMCVACLIIYLCPVNTTGNVITNYK